MRLFAAVAIPETGRASLEATTRALVSVVAGLTPVRLPSLHLTLRFFGEVDPAGGQELRRRFEGATLTTRRFGAVLGGFGQFPERGNPRVLFCGFRAGRSGLESLWKEVLALAAGFGERPPEADFTPHVTLARNKSARLSAENPAFRDFASRLDGLSLEIEVAGVRLYQSVLQRSGQEHTALAEARCAP